MPLDQPDHPYDVNEYTMPLGEHIEELRKYLIRALIGLAVGLAVACYFGYGIIAWIASPLLQAQYALGYAPMAVDTTPSFGFLSVYVPVTLIAALVFASPWVIYQVWLFVVTGLYPHERKTVYLLAPFSTIMTILAVLFARYIMIPVCVVFFLKFAATSPRIDVEEPETIIRMLTDYQPPAPTDPADAETRTLQLPVYDTAPDAPAEGMIWADRRDHRVKIFLDGETRVLMASTNRLLTPLPDLGGQIKFSAMLGLGIVIAFQVPVVMLVVGWTGLIDPRQVARIRKYAVFVTAVLAAVLTPTDPLSMFVLWIPLYGLFEFGLLLMRMVDKGVPEEL